MADESPERILTDKPQSVADALDLHVRLSALADWVKERRDEVRAWTRHRAIDRLAEDGAAPTWRLDDGSVLLTDPKPTPKINDPDEFGEWYALNVAETDTEPVPGAAWDRAWFGAVACDAVPSATTEALRRFVNAADQALDRDGSHNVTKLADAAETLADEIEVGYRWHIPEGLLEQLIAGEHAPVTVDGRDRPRLIVDEENGVAWDAATGEAVPGVHIAPAGERTVQFRPSTKARQRVRGELDALVGSPAPID